MTIEYNSGGDKGVLKKIFSKKELEVLSLPQEINVEQLHDMVIKLLNLKSIEIHPKEINSDFNQKLLIPLSKNCPGIRQFRLGLPEKDHCKMPTEDIFANMKNLKELVISGDLETIMEIDFKVLNLSSLSLNVQTLRDKKVANRLLDMIKSQKELVGLNISLCWLGEKKKNLKYLALQPSEMKAKNVIYLIKQLKLVEGLVVFSPSLESWTRGEKYEEYDFEGISQQIRSTLEHHKSLKYVQMSIDEEEFEGFEPEGLTELRCNKRFTINSTGIDLENDNLDILL